MIIGLGLTRADGIEHCVSSEAPCEEEECSVDSTWDASACECLCNEQECPRDYHWDTGTCSCERD